jgi:hypothetical protein
VGPMAGAFFNQVTDEFGKKDTFEAKNWNDSG